ncbi:MAG TPA: DUF4190 domain-containing protein [Propionibacteriaceae bacterium]|nr:DUF4190 domain-containing protein [Propionibacteriaceae bacterium]
MSDSGRQTPDDRDEQNGPPGGHGAFGAPNPFSREGAQGPAEPDAAPPVASADSPAPPAHYGSPAPGAGPGSSAGSGWPSYPYGAAGDQAARGGQNPYQMNPYQSTPYQPNPYEPSPYQAGGGYGPYGVPPSNHPQATVALVLGVVGLTLCPLLGPGALIVGNKARKAIDAEPYRFTGRGMATAGIVLGVVGTLYMVSIIVLFLLVIPSGS